MISNKSFSLPSEDQISSLLIQKVGPKVLKFFLDAYSNEGYWENGKFRGWKPIKKDHGDPVLYKSGKMKQSFDIEYVDNKTFNITNTAEYSSYHNNGTGKIPQRPIIYDDKKVDELIASEVEKELDKILNQYFK
jgi:phage gpG-like protein